MNGFDVSGVEAALIKAGISFRKDEPLKMHTSFKIGGPAALFCVPADEQEFKNAVHIAKERQVPIYLLGKGSNVLFCDEGYAGVVISTCPALSGITVEAENITVGAGVPLSHLCNFAREHALSGLEFAYGIPGSVGGAIFMNAGAYGGEIKDSLKSITYLDEEGTVCEIEGKNAKLGYRTSLFQQNGGYILRGVFSLKKGDKEAIDALMQRHMQSRRDKQPLEWPSAGSAFKRPPGAFAGALIEQCGLRGFRIGDAAISEKHCGFIVNLDSATCEQVVELADMVQKTVLEKTGYLLEKEIRIVGICEGVKPEI